MTNTDKFLADIKRVVKRYRSGSTQYDGVECSRQVAKLFCSYHKDLGDLPESIVQYWMDSYILKSPNLAEEPTLSSQSWLADVLEFLAREESQFNFITREDWMVLRDFVSYEAEELPMEMLSSLMGILLERGVL